MSVNTNPIKIPLPGCPLEYATLYTPEYIGNANFVYQGKGLISYLDKDNHVGLMNTRGEIVISAEHGWTEFQFEPEADVIRAKTKKCCMLFNSLGQECGGYDEVGLLKLTADGVLVHDANGRRVCLDSLGTFHDGLALGKKDGRFYYVDTNGRIALTIQENSEYTFHDFSDGMAMINTKRKLLQGKKYGYINKNGKIVIPPQYIAAKPFSNGFAAVMDNQGWHYIDTQGKKLEYNHPLNFEKWSVFQPSPFGANCVAAYLHPMYAMKSSGVHCILYKDGSLTIIDSRALIAAGDNHFITCDANAASSAKKYGLRDIMGIPLTEERYDVIYPVKEGSFLIAENEKWGLIDQNGKTLVPLEWDRIYPAGEFQNEFKGIKKDYALVTLKNGKYGLMDFRGNEIFPPVYDHVPFYNGNLAFLMHEDRVMLLNPKQQHVLPEDITVQNILMHGLLLVKMGGKIYFMDYGCEK